MTKVEQKRGYYSVITDAGNAARLTRVTTALDWVLGDGKSAMAYYGGKQFAKWLADEEGVLDDNEWEMFYTDWKSSEYDPNRTLRRRGKEGTAAHTLFQQLLEGKMEVEGPDHEGDYFIALPDDIPFIARGFDRGVVELYLNVFLPTIQAGADVECEKRLYWTEHPIDECKAEVCTHGFSGTCDVYWIGNAIDDLKSHVPGYRFSEWMQMAMYGLAAEQMDDVWKCDQQRIVIAHDEPDPETGLYYEVQDDRHIPTSAVPAFWELYKTRKEWGPK